MHSHIFYLRPSLVYFFQKTLQGSNSFFPINRINMAAKIDPVRTDNGRTVPPESRFNLVKCKCYPIKILFIGRFKYHIADQRGITALIFSREIKFLFIFAPSCMPVGIKRLIYVPDPMG